MACSASDKVVTDLSARPTSPEHADLPLVRLKTANERRLSRPREHRRAESLTRRRDARPALMVISRQQCRTPDTALTNCCCVGGHLLVLFRQYCQLTELGDCHERRLSLPTLMIAREGRGSCWLSYIFHRLPVIFCVRPRIIFLLSVLRLFYNVKITVDCALCPRLPQQILSLVFPIPGVPMSTANAVLDIRARTVVFAEKTIIVGTTARDVDIDCA